MQWSNICLLCCQLHIFHGIHSYRSLWWMFWVQRWLKWDPCYRALAIPVKTNKERYCAVTCLMEAHILGPYWEENRIGKSGWMLRWWWIFEKLPRSDQTKRKETRNHSEPKKTILGKTRWSGLSGDLGTDQSDKCYVTDCNVGLCKGRRLRSGEAGATLWLTFWDSLRALTELLRLRRL